MLRLDVEAGVFDERVCRERIQKDLLGERGECRVTLTMLLSIHFAFDLQFLFSSNACRNHHTIHLYALENLVVLIAIEEKLKGH